MYSFLCVERDRYLTDDEFRTLYTTAPALIQCIRDMAYITEQRISDILNIKLTDIQQGGLYVTQGKTRKKLVFEMTDHYVKQRMHARVVPLQRREQKT